MSRKPIKAVAAGDEKLSKTNKSSGGSRILLPPVLEQRESPFASPSASPIPNDRRIENIENATLIGRSPIQFSRTLSSLPSSLSSVSSTQSGSSISSALSSANTIQSESSVPSSHSSTSTIQVESQELMDALSILSQLTLSNDSSSLSASPLQVGSSLEARQSSGHADEKHTELELPNLLGPTHSRVQRVQSSPALEHSKTQNFWSYPSKNLEEISSVTPATAAESVATTTISTTPESKKVETLTDANKKPSPPGLKRSLTQSDLFQKKGNDSNKKKMLEEIQAFFKVNNLFIHFLVVEDTIPSRKLLMSQLNRFMKNKNISFDVTFAADGKTGFDEYKRIRETRKYVIIFMDRKMDVIDKSIPEAQQIKDGLEATQQIRQFEMAEKLKNPDYCSAYILNATDNLEAHKECVLDAIDREAKQENLLYNGANGQIVRDKNHDEKLENPKSTSEASLYALIKKYFNIPDGFAIAESAVVEAVAKPDVAMGPSS